MFHKNLNHPFLNFINQIGLAADDKDLYFVALMSALALPDICGALDSSDGAANGQKFRAWYEKWVANKYLILGKPSLTAHDCYKLRCAALHQGRLDHPGSRFIGVIFLEPGASNTIFHNNILNGYLNIDVKQFCIDIVQSAADWFDSVEGENPFESNYKKSMQRYPFGFGPIHGVPVIA